MQKLFIRLLAAFQPDFGCKVDYWPGLIAVVDMRDDMADTDVQERSGFGAKIDIVQKINHRGMSIVIVIIIELIMAM